MSKTSESHPGNREHQSNQQAPQKSNDVLKYKKRMLEWPNPVEYVNNMYGCHPDDNDTDYFRTVFGE